MPPPVAVGPFDLLQPVARGGMARVWRGVHREQGVPVALKIVTRSLAHRAEFERRFAEEVRAVAALDHPGVVMVLDHGRVGSTPHPGIEPDAPWLAMEYASGGTLAHIKAPLPWPMVKSVLLALLDALAHAHAHGVIHRDLKPANVLVATREDARPGIKLSDFGIAFAGRGLPLDQGDTVVGTPSYMAPEQIRGDWRDFGPWTDLYALGCLSWWLCTGSPPFAAARPQTTMMAHLSNPLPPFEPRMPVPEGFEAWLRQLLDKPIDRRFQLAADAAYALSELEAPPLPDDDVVLELDPAFQATLTATDVSFGESWRLTVDTGPRTGPGIRPRPPPIPPTWRRPVPKPPPMQLVGAGLSLYGLRAVQLAGREAERDLLWSELEEVARTGRARVVLISGPAGTGKSRLIEWLCRRAHELGAANWCKATFGQQKAPGQALQEMGIDYLRLAGLRRSHVEQRVVDFLERHGSADEAEAAVLTELLCPATPDDIEDGVMPVRLTRPREYYAGTSNTMYRLATERPLIAWFDDVQYGLHGLGLAIDVLSTQDVRPFPCLMVLSMRNEALDEDSDEARRLRRLLDIPDVRNLALGPLPPGAHRELVQGLLGLDEALAARVEERTGGNPLFAVQLVGSWVADGTLEVGERGFRLKAGARADLPDDLHAVWSAHIGRILAEFEPRAQEYLERAACLGQEVTQVEWRRACDDPEGVFGDRFPGDEPLRAILVDRLLVHRLVVGTRARWSFVHGMLRESLERTARQARRWAQHNEACAAMLARQAEDPRVAERLGRHLLEAGAPEQAVGPLLRGVEHRLVTVGAQPAQALIATVEVAMRSASLPETDARWGELWTLTARTLQDLGDLDAALAVAVRAAEAASRCGWHQVAFAAAEAEARLLIRLRRLDEARALLERLEAEAERTGDRGRLGVALAAQAEVARRSGDVGEAGARLQRAIGALGEALEVRVSSTIKAHLGQALLDWGRAAEALHRRDEAGARFRRAHQVFSELGSGIGVAECLDRLGRLAFEDGELDRASELLGRALSQYEALGAERQLSCRMRLARVALRTEPPEVWADRVWPVVERVQPQLARLDHRGRLAATYGLQLVRHALDGDWLAWDQALGEAAEAPPDAGAALGAAWLGWLAGEAAVRAGQAERGRVALRAAAALFRSMGDRARAAEVDRSLG
jgi:eukaryotic-like serine/threonine-protein kinase